MGSGIHTGEIYQSHQDPLEEQLHQLSVGLNTINDKLNSIDSKVDSIDSRLNNVESRVDSIEFRLNGVENRLNKTEITVEGIKFKMDTVFDVLSSKINFTQWMIVALGVGLTILKVMWK